MRALNIAYWSSTLLLAASMAALGIAYFTHPFFVEAFEHMGYPQDFRVLLGIAKVVGAVLLVAKVPERLKAFTYDGFAIMFVCGALAHAAAGDPPSKAAGGMIALALLTVSYFTRARRTLAPAPGGS
jgi:hypothetical protein